MHRNIFKDYTTYIIRGLKMEKLLTGIECLDNILEGGFDIPKDRGFIIQIKGDTGTGKTILALQMATHYAKSGQIACYFYLEKQVEEVFEIVTRFGWGEHKKGGWPYLAGRINHDIDKRKSIYNNGGMLVGSLPTDNLMVLYVSLASNISALSGVFERNVALRTKMSERERRLERRLKEYLYSTDIAQHRSIFCSIENFGSSL